jgi:hypothetical protein
MKVLKVPTLVRDSVRPMCADTPLHTLSESLSELSLHICLSDLVDCGVGVRVVSVPALQAQRHVQQTSTLLINCHCHCRFKRNDYL